MEWLEISKGLTWQRLHDTMAVITGIDGEATHGTGLPATCPESPQPMHTMQNFQDHENFIFHIDICI